MLFHSAILSLTHFSHSAFKTMVDPGHRDYSYTVTHHTFIVDIWNSLDEDTVACDSVTWPRPIVRRTYDDDDNTFIHSINS